MRVYRKNLRILCLLMILFVGAVPFFSQAHPLDPALMELKESAQNQFEMTWKTPVSKMADEPLKPILPTNCQITNEETPHVSSVAFVQRFLLNCTVPGLAGGVIKVDGLGAWKTDALLRIEFLNGTTVRAVLREDQDSFIIPSAQSPGQVAKDYIILGVEHILSGWDHLLFVLGLVLLVRSRRTLLWTITSFTLGHSVTLSLAALGIVHIPQAPVEVLIALSILVVAIELGRGDSQKSLSFGSRYPPLIAVIFGFLHGLGFAGALVEVGLPAKEIPLALMTFNIGIEIGQLLFVGVVLGFIAVLHSLKITWPRFTYALPAYVIGSLSSFWIIDRITKL